MMGIFVESLKRFYTEGKITVEWLESIKAENKITAAELSYITMGTDTAGSELSTIHVSDTETAKEYFDSRLLKASLEQQNEFEEKKSLFGFLRRKK